MSDKAAVSIPEPQTVAKVSSHAWLERVSRLSRYTLWSALDMFINLGVPKLVLFPLLAWIMRDHFGTFVLAISFVQLVGFAPSNGLAGYIIRDLVKYDLDRQRLLMRTTVVLSCLVVVPFGLLFIIGGGWIGRVYKSPDLADVLPFLGIYLLLMNVVETFLTMFRVRRAFGRPAIYHLVQLVLLFASIPFYKLWGLAGVGIAHAIGNIPVIVLLFLQEPETLWARPYFSRDIAGSALRVWLPHSASAFIFASAGYLDRLLMGYWWPDGEVAVFFVAANTAALVAIPAMFAQQLILSLLGKSTGVQQFSRAFFVWYALGVILSGGTLFVVGDLFGNLVLKTLYPGIANEALPLWHYAVASFAFMHVQALCRPFILKFLSPQITPALTFTSVVARIVPMLLLVPSTGKTGAVQAMLIGSAITGLLWLGIYLLYFVKPSHKLSEPLAGETTTPCLRG